MKQLRNLQREEPKTAPEEEEESEVGSLPKIRFQLGIWELYVGLGFAQDQFARDLIWALEGLEVQVCRVWSTSFQEEVVDTVLPLNRATPLQTSYLRGLSRE